MAGVKRHDKSWVYKRTLEIIIVILLIATVWLAVRNHRKLSEEHRPNLYDSSSANPEGMTAVSISIDVDGQTFKTGDRVDILFSHIEESSRQESTWTILRSLLVVTGAMNSVTVAVPAQNAEFFKMVDGLHLCRLRAVPHGSLDRIN